MCHNRFTDAVCFKLGCKQHHDSRMVYRSASRSNRQTRKPEIFNTDQGSQYTSEIHTKLLIRNDIKISMDGKGRAIDTIFIERLWRSVKYENVYLQAYGSTRELYKGLKEYFRFYNDERFHQSLEYQTPSEMYNKLEVA